MSYRIIDILEFTKSPLSIEQVEARINKAKELGYECSPYPPDKGGHIYKTFQNYKYQGNGWQKYSTAYGIFLLSDEDWYKELLHLPERELVALEQLKEHCQAAELELSLQEGRNELENKNQILDRELINNMIPTIKNIITGNPMKSVKYNKCFEEILYKLNELVKRTEV